PRPGRAASPVKTRALPRMVGVMLDARRVVLLHRAVASGDRVEVLLALPLAAAGVVEDGHAGKVAGALAARMIAAVLNVEDDPAPQLVDDVPFVAGVDLEVLGHDRHDPLPDVLATAHVAVHVLDVLGVVGEEVAPGVPVLAHRSGAPVGAKRLLELVAAEGSH